VSSWRQHDSCGVGGAEEPGLAFPDEALPHVLTFLTRLEDLAAASHVCRY